MQLLVRIGERGSLKSAVDARDGAGMTPLFTALSAGATHVAALLLAAGAELDAADNRGVTPRAMMCICMEKIKGKVSDAEAIAAIDVAAALAHAEETRGARHLVLRFKDILCCQLKQ
jgi:hypothetical protein